jgi:hypothetical protein
MTQEQVGEKAIKKKYYMIAISSHLTEYHELNNVIDKEVILLRK